MDNMIEINVQDEQQSIELCRLLKLLNNKFVFFPYLCHETGYYTIVAFASYKEHGDKELQIKIGWKKCEPIANQVEEQDSIRFIKEAVKEKRKLYDNPKALLLGAIDSVQTLHTIRLSELHRQRNEKNEKFVTDYLRYRTSCNDEIEKETQRILHLINGVEEEPVAVQA